MLGFAKRKPYFTIIFTHLIMAESTQKVACLTQVLRYLNDIQQQGYLFTLHSMNAVYVHFTT